MLSVLALADDLTGALEAGAKFAAAGMSSMVRVHGAQEANGAAAIVIDTETRHLSPQDAAGIIASIDTAGAAIIYKKTDSTLRGNIAAELGALAAMHPGARIAYIPAYPAMGRTVANGILYVHGVPVHETSFARDALNPIGHSVVADHLRGLECTIHEGELDRHVSDAVALALAEGYRIIAGPASVAEAIAQAINPPTATPVWPHIRTCLIVNGSLHAISAQQVEHAVAAGCASESPIAAWRILQPGITSRSPLEHAAETGEYVRSSLAAGGIDGLLIFGGDTAYGILAAMGLPLLEPIGEVMPGVPIARVQGKRLHLITKAGGFGDANLICQVKSIVHTAEIFQNE
jgi:uncharacterized protein YgbK (DUF1537 family)